MPEDAVCEQTWTVVPTGRVGASYEFFTVYDSSLGAQATTSKVSITILEKEEEPPVVEEPEPRRRSSGSATRVGTRNNEQAGEGQVLGIQTSNQYTERMQYIQLQFIKILTMYVQMLSGAGR
jgi:hypothetical protein